MICIASFCISVGSSKIFSTKHCRLSECTAKNNAKAPTSSGLRYRISVHEYLELTATLHFSQA